MKIEIWSDVMCPFCYIGKTNLEQAINSLPYKNEIQVIWKSYQLSPEYTNLNNENLYEYLARSKNISVEQAKEMTSQVTEFGKNSGLKINFETNIPANTFQAHQIIHFAATQNLQNETKEAFFKAHFEDGKNIANEDTLLEISTSVGLDALAIKSVLDNNTFADAVKQDIYESQQMGVRGVPYFVFNEESAVSGAQPIEVFEQIIADLHTKTQSTILKNETENNCSEDNCAI
ncbi:MAG: DsbA family oxidoreductase [Sphingobacteriaceae bacterium]|nr:DsbA family oxidoreductase [Sphingobacteriaceae bacterium]